MTYYDDVITGTSGVTHYWKFDGNGTDSVGSTSVTIASGYDTSTAGRQGNALTGDSSATKTGCYASIANTVFDTTYSVELWFKLSTSGMSSGDYQEIMRMGNELALEMQYDGKIHYYYQGTDGLTSTTYGDNAWHHLVITRDSSRNVIVYLDGTSRITFTAPTGAPGSTPLYLAGTQYNLFAFHNAQLDSVSMYTTALTSTQVTAHMNAMSVVSVGFTASAVTASAAMPDALGKGNVYNFNVTDDTYTSTTDLSTTNNGTSFGLNAGTASTIWIKVPTLAGTDAPQTIDTETLYLKSGSSPYFSGNISVYTVNGAWTELGLTKSNEPSKTLVRTVSATTSSGSPWAAINVKDADIGYGIALVTTSSSAAFGSSDAGGTSVPYVTYTVSPFSASAFTVSATMVAPTISTVTNPTISPVPLTATGLMVAPTVVVADAFAADSMTADASLVAPTWSTDGNVTVIAEDIEAFVEFPGGFHEGPVTVSAGVVTASAATVDAAVSVEVGATIAAAPLTSTARWLKPSGINGAPISIPETEDKYFNRVYAATPKIWYRLNETTGTHVYDRMDTVTDISLTGATYHNVDIGNFDGPDGRASVYFNGNSYIEQTERSGTNVDEATLTFDGTTRTTLEFGMRTAKRQQFIMGGRDDALTQSGANNVTSIETPLPARELWLIDGKISMTTWFFPNSLGQQRDPYQFVGFRDLADGNWHHIVVKGYANLNGEEGVEIWVDGRLEIRRTGNPSGAGPWNGMPDFIGWRPSTIDGVTISTLPSTQNYVGDIAEVAFYPNLLSDDAIPRHYYDFMAWNPVEVVPSEAFAFTPAGAKGKGNQKRMLVLTWNPVNGDMGYNPFYNDTALYDFNGIAGHTGQFSGWKVFPMNIAIKGPGTEVYRDIVTDAPTLLSLKNDIDIKDYDAIAFTDWPFDGQGGDFPTALRPSYERLIGDIRWACDQGLGLFITHPRIALDLGIIDRIELAPSQKEVVAILAQGNAQGLYDYGSAVDFPWNIAATSAMDDTWGGKGSRYNGEDMDTSPTFLSNKAFFYGDTHKNDKFRVRALIAGLTDIPSYMTEKAIFQVDQSSWGWQIVAFKYLHRENGLQIGDEYIFWGTDYGFNNNWISSMGWNSTGRWGGGYATPLANVKAGTVVTTFGASYWQGKSIIDNPYKDYATTIVLQPGDSLNGTPVGGKIYVNFTEQPWLQAGEVSKQVIPDDDTPANWPNSYHVETNEQRQWDYSETRKSLTVTGVQESSVTYQVAMPDGSLVAITGSQNGSQTLNMVRSNELFPTKHYPSWQMNRRGLLWLYDSGVTDGEGDVTIRVAPLTATAEVKQPSIVAQKSNTVPAEPMRALEQMPKVAEDQSGDVDIVTLPLEADATFTGFSKVISVEPIEAFAELLDPAEVLATGEQFVLYLQNVPQVTLFLKEEV